MSNFRLRDCIIKEEDLINRAIELNHSVLAITDHESIAAAVRVEKLYKKVKEKNIPLKIIMGNEIYLCRDGLNNETYVHGEDRYYHFILLSKDLIGFQQICELSTRAWMRSYKSRGIRRVPTYYQDIVEVIGANPGHVIGTTACLGGMLATQLLKYRETEDEVLWKKILNWCNLMKNTFGGKDYFYLELQPSESKEQSYVNRKLIEISSILDIDYIITTDTHYLTKEDRPIHKAYLNSQDGDREVDSFYATTYLMDTEELESHLELSREELDKAYNNILKIQNLCEDYSILKPLKIPSLKWNDYSYIDVTEDWFEKIPYLRTFYNSDFIGDRVLVKATIDGINKHYDLQNKEAYNEINSNLEMTWISSNVNKAHWSAYYLNLQKIIDLCWEADSIVGPGRGSGVGFILLYALGITQINPLRETTKTFSWRFLNPERVSVLDIDFDIEGSKRDAVLHKFREFYGEDRVANVTTFRTEKSKSAILTAARGLGIDNDTAQYLASLIPSDRGQLRTLKEVYYGDVEKDFKPVSAFVNAMNNEYQDLWQVAQKIEGLICGTGVHAGGVIFVDEPFTLSTALMRAPDGTICTQFDLHDAEDVSLIKYDALSVEAMDKIHACLDLLCEHNYIAKEKTLKETYEKAIGIYKLDRDSEDMWEMIWNHKVLDLFQMEKQSGVQGIALAKPKSVNDLSVLNSVIRLMAPDKDSDTPLVTWSKYRENINLWIAEMRRYGLSEDEIDWLSHHSAVTQGICESQEGLMQLVQEPRLGGNSLNFADRCRKGIAKKQGKLFQECEDEFYENIKKNNCSEKLAHYVWDELLKVQRGYSFNRLLWPVQA
jgi:DNA polymerase-3 subunit alpha